MLRQAGAGRPQSCIMPSPPRGWSAGEDGAEPLEDTEVLRDRLQRQPEDALPAVGQTIPTVGGGDASSAPASLRLGPEFP